MQIKIIIRPYYILSRKSKLEISAIMVADEDKIRKRKV